MFFLKAAEIQVTEDIAQQNEPSEGKPFQRVQSSFGTADFRTQVQVRKDHRVMTRRVHDCIMENAC